MDWLMLVVVAACAWSLLREGLWGAGLIFLETVFAGLVAMNFFEPLGALIAKISFLENYGDLLAICLLFAVLVTILREIDIRLCPAMVRFANWLHKGGGLLFGVLTGLVVAGLLLCAVQTVPFSKSIGLGYSISKKSFFGLGPDRKWLAFVHRTSKAIFDRPADPDYPDEHIFDADASFIDRYFVVRVNNTPIEPFEDSGAPAPSSSSSSDDEREKPAEKDEDPGAL